MSSLYKKPVLVTDPRTGRRIKTKSKKWWGRYRDENGQEKRVPLATDRSAAQTMLNDLVRKVERTIAGLEDPFGRHHKRPLREHIRDLEAYLHGRERTPRYVRETIYQVRSVVTACKFERIKDISASRVQEFLAQLRADGKSISSSNHYLRAIKMFTRWLVRDRRTDDNCLAHLSTLNEDLDRRHVRRPLTPDEFARLVEAAEKGPKVRSIRGPDRAVLYIVGAYTGYRRNEIGSVTMQSFDLESEPPTLTVAAGYSKHRQTDVLPLRRDFAERIREWIASKSRLDPNRPLFGVTNRKTAEIIRRDLAAARKAWIEEAKDAVERKKREESSFLSYVDDQGHVVDFHSLRKTFVTNLSLAGVMPKAAQTLARHSDINLTMNSYTTLRILDQAAAVEALPPIPNLNGSVRRSSGAKGRDGRRNETVLSGSDPPVPPDVAQLIAAWSELPESMRTAILTSARAVRSANRLAQ